MPELVLDSAATRLSCPGTLFCSADFHNQTSGSVKKSVGARMILVVDDEQLVADSVAEILRRNGYDTTSVYNGTAAVEIVQDRCPDVLMCDMLMPDLDGIATAVAVRELCKKTRILLFSGHVANAEIVTRARSAGYDFEFLAKPLHPATLLQILGS
jgi:CheY-like chemotaxis protein